MGVVAIIMSGYFLSLLIFIWGVSPVVLKQSHDAEKIDPTPNNVLKS